MTPDAHVPIARGPFDCDVDNYSARRDSYSEGSGVF